MAEKSAGRLKRLLRGAASSLVALALVLIAIVGHAEQRPRVAVVLEGDIDERVQRRLLAELDSLGFDVIERQPGATSDPQSLETIAREEQAFAAMRIAPSRGGVELWIVDRVTGKTVLREIALAREQPLDEVIALQAVELLRASLLELNLRGSTRGEVKAPPAVRRLGVVQAVPLTPSDEERIALGFGAALVLSPNDATPTVHVVPSARLVLTRSLGMHAFALLPTFPHSIEASEGAADVSITVAALGVDASLGSLGASWRARAGVSAALIQLRVVGVADPPFGATSETLWLGAPLARLDLFYHLLPAFRIGPQLMFGVALPRAVVTFAGREVASWGQPFGSAGLSLEAVAR
jgi:alkylhydroperoxidase family enzyme